MQDNADSVSSMVGKLSLPGSVLVADAAGLTLEDWVFVLTIVLTLLMILHHIIWKWVIPIRAAAAARRAFREKMQLPGDPPK